MKDFYAQIDKALKEYELFQPYKRYSISWISDRIVWCYKFKHISKEQMHGFCDRVIVICENYI